MKPTSSDARSRALLSEDTDPAVERLLIALWRDMTPSAKLRRVASASSAVVALARAGARARDPQTPGLFNAFAVSKLGPRLAADAYGARLVSDSEPEVLMDHLAIVALVVRALDSCGLRYVIGGSLASSVSGEPRATLDADLMIDLDEASIACVVRGLGSDFYADAEAFRRAVRQRSSVNVVHLASATKIDLFVMGATSIEAQQMDRRQLISIGSPPVDLYVYTAEDILLQKLRWFRLGGEVSERQWRDVVGIVAVQGERLDREYLRSCAAAIGVLDLLERVVRS
ncbi:MAG TPA: hypothetical protein VEL79_19085 [Vicinamibacterales bacterium]|nr:hypothetical protein [Vicinamibacterales bacterium]